MNERNANEIRIFLLFITNLVSVRDIEIFLVEKLGFIRRGKSYFIVRFHYIIKANNKMPLIEKIYYDAKFEMVLQPERQREIDRQYR